MGSKIEKVKEETASGSVSVALTSVDDGINAEGNGVSDKDPVDVATDPVHKPKRKRVVKQAVAPGVSVSADHVGDGSGTGTNDIIIAEKSSDYPQTEKIATEPSLEAKRPAEGKLDGNSRNRGIFKKIIYYREPTRPSRAKKSKPKSVQKSNPESDVYEQDSEEDGELVDDSEDDEEDYDDDEESNGEESDEDGIESDEDDDIDEIDQSNTYPKKRTMKATKPKSVTPAPMRRGMPLTIKPIKYTFV